MGTANDSFNLVDEPWIRVRTLTDEVYELSLRGVFSRAHELKGLENDLPTQDFALLRLLEAVLERSVVPMFDDYDYPFELWGELWSKGELPHKAIDEYLDAWKVRFDLLDEERPFMQVAKLRATNGSISEVKKIMADCPDGLPLFALKSGEGADSLTLSEAARWVVHTHAFDTSGIKTGVVGDKGVKGGKSYPIGTGWAGGIGGVYLEGDNLARTLLLNLCLCADCEKEPDEFLDEDLDLPVWERSPSKPGDSGHAPGGYADIYTWQSRRMLVHWNGSVVDGIVLTNGDKLEYQNKRVLEPMTAWRRSLPQEKKLKISPVYLPFTHQLDRSFWRGLTAVLPMRSMAAGESFKSPGIVLWAGYLASANGGRKLASTYPIRLHASGFVYGVQSAVFSEMVDEALMLNAFLLSPDGVDAVELVKECIEKTNEAVRALGYLATNLRLASGCDAPMATDARERIQAEAYYELDGLFLSWLAGINDGSARALQKYESAWHDASRKVLGRLGSQLVSDADDLALKGRKIKQGNREVWMSAGRAESQFRHALKKHLGTMNYEQYDEVKEG